jgi:outer membrane protein assembly factor BamB
VFNGLVYFGMDINDSGTGKGGMYAVRADDGRLAWYFDLETGATCRPFAADDIRRFDGYHTAEELGLPADFFATRPGCDFDRFGTQCGNVWSSASIDPERGLLYIASSNCDTDDDPESRPPPPPMPPYDRALFALTLDGDPAWVWRPSEVDCEDLSFGAAPNLFEAEIEGVVREVVGIGNKDGTYYVLDRDGINEINGVTASDPPEVRNEQLPYWKTNVVPGGNIGGITGSAAVAEGRISFSTGPGFDVFDPQLPAAWSLDANTGAVAWSNPDVAPSFGPTAAVPGLVLMGTLALGNLNVLAAPDGELLAELNVHGAPSGCASVPAVVDGTIFVGAGIGELGGNPTGLQHITANIDTPVSAFCVAGTLDCPNEPLCDDGNPCTYDFREDGECGSEPAPNTLSCTIPVAGGPARPGSCVDGVCVATP